MPSVVEFSIDEATAAQIVGLAAIVKSNGLYKVEKFDYRARYLKHDPEQDPEDAKLAGEENEFRTEADVLNVSDEQYWFSAYIKHTDIEILSEQQRIDDLVQHFAFDRLPDAHDSAIGAPLSLPIMVASKDERVDGQDVVTTTAVPGHTPLPRAFGIPSLERSSAMTRRYHVFIREHQILRFRIEIQSAEDVRAAILEARRQYEQSGAQWSTQAETEIDDAEIFGVDELDPHSGSITASFDFDSLSTAVGAPID